MITMTEKELIEKFYEDIKPKEDNSHGVGRRFRFPDFNRPPIITGTQPMTGPVGLAYTLRFTGRGTGYE